MANETSSPSDTATTPKPGYKSTEFWSMLVANLIALAVLFGYIPVENKAQAQDVAIQLIAAVNGVYAIGRSIVKR